MNNDHRVKVEHLRQALPVIGGAGETEKAQAILGGLHSGLVNVNRKINNGENTEDP
jgi:hypothetical protein